MKRNRMLVWFALIALSAVLAAILLRSEPETLYRIRFLPGLGGSGYVIPHSINDHGHVVGVAEVSPNQWHMFIWDEDGGARDLGICADRRYLDEAVMINNVGQIIATTVDPNGNCSVFLLDPNGIRHILRAPNRERIHVRALNNRGRVVGYYNAERSPRQAFVWDKRTGTHDLDSPNTIESLACGINDAGQVVGFLSTQRNTEWYAVQWDPNTGMQYHGATQFGPTRTCRINGQGFVVGIFGSVDDDAYVSMWTREEGMKKAPWLWGREARVVGLNDANHFIVCTIRKELRIRQSAARWHTASFIYNPKEGFKDIARCLGRADAVEFMAKGINNKGQIIGQLRLKKQTDFTGVILEPIQ